MSKRLKRVVCSLLVMITIIGYVLPLLPEGLFEVNAADIFEDPSHNGRTLYTWSSKLHDMEIEAGDEGELFDEYGFADSSSTQRLNMVQFDDANEAKFKVQVENVLNSIPISYDGGIPLRFNFDYMKNRMVENNIDINRARYECRMDSFNEAWDYITEDTILISGSAGAFEHNSHIYTPILTELTLGAAYYASSMSDYYGVAVSATGYNPTRNKYYYIVVVLLDAQAGIGTTWDTFNLTVVESTQLLSTSDRIYNDGDIITSENDIDDSGVLSGQYTFADLNDDVSLTGEDIERIHNDMINRRFNEISTYSYLNSISQSTMYGDINNPQYAEEGYYRFGTTARLDFFMDYTDSTHDGEDSKYSGYRLFVQPYDEFIIFEDMPGDSGNNTINVNGLNRNGYYQFNIDDAFLDFGDSTAFFQPNPDSSEGVQKIALSIAKIIEAMCSCPIEDNTEWTECATLYANALATAYPDSITIEIKNFIDRMQDRQKMYQLDGAGQDMSVDGVGCEDLSIYRDQYKILNKILAYNINQTFNKKMVSERAEVKCADGKVKLTFDNSLRGSCDTDLGVLWEACTGYQQYMLAYTFHRMHDLRFESSLGNDWENISITGATSKLGLYSREIATQLSGNQQLSIESLKAVIDSRDKTITNTRSVLNVARNANSLGQYIIGISLYSEGDSAESGEKLYSIYDATLHSMLHLNYEYEDVNMDWYPTYVPSRLGIMSESVGSSQNTLSMLLADDEEDLEIFVMFMYNLTYAFEVGAFSEAGQNSGYTVEMIESALKGSQTVSNGSSSDPDGYFNWITSDNTIEAWKANTSAAKDFPLQGNDYAIGMFRSIIELHDFCEFLEILDSDGNLIIDWTDTIKGYLNLYNNYREVFEALRQNPDIYNLAPQGESTPEEPLGNFFNIANKQLTDNWIKGFSLSSQYVPMETNLYDATSVEMIEDSDWISDFYYKYAFYRKALYINTDNSAIVNAFISQTQSTTRVATLRDLLNYDRDIILTIDDNFYNADDVSDVISKLDYASVRQNTDATAKEDGSQLYKMTDWVSGAFSLAPGQILKTGQEMYYSDTLAQICTKLNKSDDATATILQKAFDTYLLPQDEILGDDAALNDYEYSVKQSYAVVSAIYRSESLYNETLKAIVSDNAIFKSSKAICYTPGTSSADWRALYNYYMLANLSDQMKNDAASTLDLDAPIFCDIFGNIVTESGLVIIPAASNPTLCGKDWNPYTVGFAEYYNNGEHIKTGEFADEVYTWLLGYEYSTVPKGPDEDPVLTSTERVKKNGGGHFEIDRGGDLILRTTSLSSNNLTAIIQWNALNKNSTIIKQLFFNDAYFTKGKNMYHNRIVNMIVETLRGAPIESIDYTYEGLDGNMDISKYGIYMAYKLEELTNSLISGTNGNATGGNAAVTMPNLAFVSGIEYIVLYVFKIVFAVAVAGLAVSLYLDAVVNSLGIRSVGKFIITVSMVIVAITLVPNLISWSYYKANKDLLSDEVGYIMMLNYCKEFDGSEIGITSVNTPETNTELFLKVDDISVDWWDIIDDVLFKNTFKTVTELYESQKEGNAMQGLPGVITKGDGLYVNVQDIYGSTNMNYLPATGVIKNTVYGSGSSDNSVDTVTSFTLPYYTILEQLIANINEYNITRDITAYSYSVGANGSILTYDIIGPYLRSDEFLLDGYDILGLDKILNLKNQRLCYNFAFTDSDINKMRLSQWYPTDMYTQDMKASAVDRIYEAARVYVADNAELIGKVPDEVFLKVMAMQMAIEFNREFGAPYGRSIEIMNIDTRDLARFMVSDRASMYKYFSYGYARYVYEEAGGIGVIFAAIFTVILYLTAFVKPVFMVIILGLLIFNTIFRKLLFRKESKSIEGYLIGCACLCLVNYAYSAMLKVSLNIANTELGSITALACAIIVQLLYIFGLCLVLRIEIKDWKNSGYGEFKNVGANILAGVTHAKQVVVERLIAKNNESYASSAPSRRFTSGDVDMGTIDDMIDRDQEREEKGTYSPA